MKVSSLDQLYCTLLIDPAHTIQNAQSQLAQACCALQSSNRWAITGTPIQNKLTDFASIVKFLQVYPYSEQESFDKDISLPWRSGDPQGFLRLKTLVRAITISRTKDVVRLPPRSNFIHHLDFTDDERQLYEDAKKQTLPLLRQAILSPCQGGSTFNALQRLNSLRLICSHGLLAQSNMALCHPSPYMPVGMQDTAFGSLVDWPKSCSQCGMDLDDILEGSLSAGMDGLPVSTQHRPTMCERCTSQRYETDINPWHHANHFNIPNSPMSLNPPPPIEQGQYLPSIDLMPTKVKALVADLLHNYIAEKRLVPVFSQKLVH